MRTWVRMWVRTWVRTHLLLTYTGHVRHRYRTPRRRGELFDGHYINLKKTEALERILRGRFFLKLPIPATFDY